LTFRADEICYLEVFLSERLQKKRSPQSD
jgi:hypothetical protein